MTEARSVDVVNGVIYLFIYPHRVAVPPQREWRTDQQSRQPQTQLRDRRGMESPYFAVEHKEEQTYNVTLIREISAYHHILDQNIQLNSLRGVQLGELAMC